MLIAVGLTGSRQGSQVLDVPVLTVRFLIEHLLIADKLTPARFLIRPVLIAVGLTGSKRGSKVLYGPVLTVNGLGQQAGQAAQPGF